VQQPWWLGRAEPLLRALAIDPAWANGHADWEIKRRDTIRRCLIASHRVQAGDREAWAQGLELVKASMADREPRMAMVVGLGLFQAMVHGGASAEVLPLLESIRAGWNADHGADPMLRHVNYLLSKALRALGRHEEAHCRYRDYARAASSIASARGELPQLPPLKPLQGPSEQPSANPRDAAPAGLPGYLRHAIEGVQREISSPQLSVQVLAERAGVSTRTLQAAFGRHLGVSPARYIEQTRLARAHVLLASGCATLGVAEVAQQCGFAHAGRFAMAYRKRFGVSPAERQRMSRAARVEP
jgi:AraC-like DNA-binding protein